MNAVERLEAAITKLERLKVDSWPTLNIYRLDDRLIVAGEDDDDHAPIVFDRSRTSSVGDSELVVTLHRTIDAQLAILRTILHYVRFGLHRGFVVEEGLALADAILGGES